MLWTSWIIWCIYEIWRYVRHCRCWFGSRESVDVAWRYLLNSNYERYFRTRKSKRTKTNHRSYSSIYSNSSIRASANVFVFFIGMVTSYYLYSNYVAGFFQGSYAMIWFGFTIFSPFFAFVCWYAKGKSKPAFMLSILILAVLFNMTFIYGWGYFWVPSVLELVVYIIGFIVLRRDTLRNSVLMGTISIVLAFLLNMVIPFQFG